MAGVDATGVCGPGEGKRPKCAGTSCPGDLSGQRRNGASRLHAIRVTGNFYPEEETQRLDTALRAAAEFFTEFQGSQSALENSPNISESTVRTRCGQHPKRHSAARSQDSSRTNHTANSVPQHLKVDRTFE